MADGKSENKGPASTAAPHAMAAHQPVTVITVQQAVGNPGTAFWTFWEAAGGVGLARSMAAESDTKSSLWCDKWQGAMKLENCDKTFHLALAKLIVNTSKM